MIPRATRRPAGGDLRERYAPAARGDLIVPPDLTTAGHRALIISLASR